MHTPSQKPVIRVLHHMARSGGTVISKCIASMNSVVLLSEIHPLGLQQHNPLLQAGRWFGLFSPWELQDIRQRRISFLESIEMIRTRVEASGHTLVIRDWSHLDFTGIPFIEAPAYRLLLAELLREKYRVIHTATVRHPVDQWISLNKVAIIKDHPGLTAAGFLYGYARFAEHASRMGFVRYEDFVRDSNSALRTLCDHLELAYDPGYRDKWAAYNRITGDNTTTSESRYTGENRIATPTPQLEYPAVLEEFSRNRDFINATRLLGYPLRDS
jgi:hypothetical protein